MEEAVLEPEKVQEISDRFYSGARLSFEDGLNLYQYADLPELARMADWTRRRNTYYEFVD